MRSASGSITHPSTYSVRCRISLKEYSHWLKLEVAQGLLHAPALTVEGVAGRCGFGDARQLRGLWRRTQGESPATWRSRGEPG